MVEKGIACPKCESKDIDKLELLMDHKALLPKIGAFAPKGLTST